MFKTLVTGNPIPVAIVIALFALALSVLGESHAPGNAQAGQPDLTVESADVWVSPQRPIGGDVVIVKVAVRNLGDVDAVGVTVDFEDNSDGALPVPVDIGSTIVDVPTGAVAIAEVAWDTSGQLAENIVTINIDPGDDITETDEENNEASAKISSRR